MDWDVSGASSSPGYRGQAEFFVPGVSGYLSSVELATCRSGGSSLSSFYLAEDNGSGIPGTIVESWLSVQNANGLLTLTSLSQPLLQAGQEYWVCDEPAAANSDNGWYENNQNRANGFAYDNSEWGWSAIPGGVEDNGVFSVSVTPVPEPSIAVLTLLGISLLARRFRRGA